LDIDLSTIKDWRVAASVELAQAEFKDHHLTLSVVIRKKHIQSSPRYLGGLFKRDIGVSFHGYLRALRMRAASEALVRENARVKDVAIALGYDGMAGNFVNDFKRYYGTTPGKWPPPRGG
jgi:two-component system, response regulator YesN